MGEHAAGPPSSRTRLIRIREQGRYDRETIEAILDAGLVCQVGFTWEGAPQVVPTLHARDGDALLLHGSSKMRLARAVRAGAELCISVTLLDGIVLARAQFEHSIRYRSATVFGRGDLIEEPVEKLAACTRFTDS